jgi:hypothetical protein
VSGASRLELTGIADMVEADASDASTAGPV